jgi:hypothetical protein
MHAAERLDARALDHLEGIVRELGDELAAWRARALKAEADVKGGGGTAARDASPRGDGAARSAVMTELEAENHALRQRIAAARGRVADLVARLAFLEEQAGAPAGTGQGR